MHSTECNDCGKEFEFSTSRDTPFTEHNPPRFCPSCVEERRAEHMANVEEPEGGWPRNTDLDRL